MRLSPLLVPLMIGCAQPQLRAAEVPVEAAQCPAAPVCEKCVTPEPIACSSPFSGRIAIDYSQVREFRDDAPIAPLGEIVTCVFKGQSLAQGYGTKDAPSVAASSLDSPLTLVIVGINSETPVLKGNHGESPVRVLKRTGSTLDLIEVLPDTTNVIALNTSSKTAVMTKAVNTPTAQLGVVWIGKCY